MKLTHSLLAATITLSLSAVAHCASAQSLPARMAATSGLATVNDPAAPGWLQRASLMMADDNFRGAMDQLNQLLPTLPEGPEREAACLMLAQTSAHIPGEDAAGLFNDFLQKYPASQYRMEALVGLANVLFDKADYIAADAVYRSIERSALNPSVAEDLAIRFAFCEILLGNDSQAESLLTPLLKTPAANDARYYLAYIDYISGRYPQALEEFSKVRNTGSSPTNTVPYYLAQLYYQKGDYAEALKEAKSLLNNDCPKQYRGETARIAGESLYGMGHRDAAIPYLKEYIEYLSIPLVAPTHRNAVYILGEDAYDKGNYPKAIEWLSMATERDDERAQRAYLLIGQSYMQQGNYDSALLAFDRAVKIGLDPSVTESAAYNYAVASSQGGKLPFASSIAQFEDFVKKYPESKYASKVNDYIINGYITDNNYGEALAAINRIAKPSDKVLAAKQQVLYLHGGRQLQAGRTDDAIRLLTEARSLGRFSGETASEATLWLGEAYYQKGNYKEAVKNYASFLNELPASNPNYPLALYDMAYGQFALKDFPKATDYFSKYLKAADKKGTDASTTSLKADALNRLGDSFYYQKDLESAAATYKKSIAAAEESADYPMYQLAVIKGLQRDNQGKINDITALVERFPNSPLIPSALLELAESYSAIGKTNSANETYALVARAYPSTPQGREGLLLLAIGQINAGLTDKAIQTYKQVISKYPTSQEARTAAEDLKHIYADRGDIAAYTDFLASVPDAPKLDQKELVALQLEAVEKAYDAERDNDAIRGAEQLITAYPDSPEAVDALVILATLREKQGRPAEAKEAYIELEKRAANEIDMNAARLGLLRISRNLGDNLSVLDLANKLLASSSLSTDDRQEVMLAQGLAYTNMGKHAEGDKLLSQLASNIETLAGAKAAYYLAQSQYDRGNRQAALTTVNKLIAANPPYEYFLARGFILQADIKADNGETLEAAELLKALRDNYPGTEADIFSMIDQRLK